MFEDKFPFDPRKDKHSVEQFGYVDIVSVVHSNSLPAVEAEGADSYNGIDDPSSILGKPSDVFEAMAMQEAINDFKPDSDPESSE